MQQIISIHVGQCGIQIGSALWELLTFEHSIFNDGTINEDLFKSDDGVGTFFHSCKDKQCVPRSLFIDLEPTVIDQIKTGCYRQLFHPDQLINGTEDAANNFARGFYTSGRIIKNMCQMRLRKEIEMSDRLHAIHIYRSLGGGTGSGMTATIFEILSEVAKITKIEIPIHPSPHLSSSVVEPYNCILAEHYCMDDIDMTMLMDNEALYDVVSDEISIAHPTLTNVNRIVAQVCSSVTSSIRFQSELSNDFTIMTNLVPYPRIHYPLVSYAPFGNSEKLDREVNSVIELTRSVFKPSNLLVKCDSSTGKYMSCSLLFRGSISPPEVHEALCEIKLTNSIRFVDWCPTGFKVGIVTQQPHILPQSEVGETPRNVIMMTNNSAVSIVWHRLSQKFHKLYSKRSFVHWFVSEGLEETEFCESLFNLATLAKDYEEVSLDTEVNDEMKNSLMDKISTNSVTVTESSKTDKNAGSKMQNLPKKNTESKISKSVSGAVSRNIERDLQIHDPLMKDNEHKSLKSHSIDKRVDIETENQDLLTSKISKPVERESKLQNSLISSKSMPHSSDRRVEIETEDQSLFETSYRNKLSNILSDSIGRNVETEQGDEYIVKGDLEDNIYKALYGSIVSNIDTEQKVLNSMKSNPRSKVSNTITGSIIQNEEPGPEPEPEQDLSDEYILNDHVVTNISKISNGSIERNFRTESGNEIPLQSYSLKQNSKTFSGSINQNVEYDPKVRNSLPSNKTSRAGSIDKSAEAEKLVENSLKSNPKSQSSKTMSVSINRNEEPEQISSDKYILNDNVVNKISKVSYGSFEKNFRTASGTEIHVQSYSQKPNSKTRSDSINQSIESDPKVRNSLQNSPKSKISLALSGSIDKGAETEQLIENSLKSNLKSQTSKTLSVLSVNKNEEIEPNIEQLWKKIPEAKNSATFSSSINRNIETRNESLMKSNLRSGGSKTSSGSMNRKIRVESNNDISSKENFSKKMSKASSNLRSINEVNSEKLSQRNFIDKESANLVQTIEKVIQSAESYENPVDRLDLSYKSEEPQFIEENVTTDITEQTEENFVKEDVESESETEIKTVTDTDTVSDSQFYVRNSSVTETKDAFIGLEKIGDFLNEKQLNEIEDPEMQDIMDLNLDLDNYNDQNKLQKNFSNSFSLVCNESLSSTDRNMQQLIQTLSFNDKKSINTDEFDLFLDKYSSNSDMFNSTITKRLSFENKVCSRFALLNSKSKFNRRCCTSLDDFGNGRDEEGTHYLMEELIRITAEINI